MAIYVDSPNKQYGRMRMRHMIADSTTELLAMADAIRVNRKWIQKPGTKYEHFDICKSKRDLAVERGAIEVSSRELVSKIRAR